MNTSTTSAAIGADYLIDSVDTVLRGAIGHILDHLESWRQKAVAEELFDGEVYTWVANALNTEVSARSASFDAGSAVAALAGQVLRERSLHSRASIDVAYGRRGYVYQLAMENCGDLGKWLNEHHNASFSLTRQLLDEYETRDEAIAALAEAAMTEPQDVSEWMEATFEEIDSECNELFRKQTAEGSFDRGFFLHRLARAQWEGCIPVYGKRECEALATHLHLEMLKCHQAN